MNGGSIIILIFAIIMIVTNIIKSIKENAGIAKHQQPEAADDELVIIRPNKPIKQIQKPHKQRLAEGKPVKVLPSQPSILEDMSTESAQKKALVKKLAPQGEGHRFVADPGTLDTSNIVASTIDPTVKPGLGSITGIYEQDVAIGATQQTVPMLELNLLDGLRKPEGICHAIIFAEIMNRPAWIDMPR